MNWLSVALISAGVGIPFYAVHQWNRELTGNVLSQNRFSIGRIVTSLLKLVGFVLFSAVAALWLFAVPVCLLLWLGHIWGAWYMIIFIGICIVIVMTWGVLAWRD